MSELIKPRVNKLEDEGVIHEAGALRDSMVALIPDCKTRLPAGNYVYRGGDYSGRSGRYREIGEQYHSGDTEFHVSAHGENDDKVLTSILIFKRSRKEHEFGSVRFGNTPFISHDVINKFTGEILVHGYNDRDTAGRIRDLITDTTNARQTPVKSG